MILFTHNDLDAVGCEMCVREAGYNIEKVFYEDYATFEQTVCEMIEYAQNHGITSVFIADLSFAERPHTLQMILDNFRSVVHIDHHSYPEGFSVTPKNTFKQVIDTERCACRICYDVLKLSSIPLKGIITVIDVLDRWVETSPLFDNALRLNEYFWHVGYQTFLKKFLKYEVPSDYRETLALIESENTAAINEMLSLKRIMHDRKVIIQIDPRFMLKVMLDGFKNGMKGFVMYTGSIIRIRLSQRLFTKEQAEELRMRITSFITGHPHAFTYKYKSVSPEALFAELKRVSDLINGHNNE